MNKLQWIAILLAIASLRAAASEACIKEIFAGKTYHSKMKFCESESAKIEIDRLGMRNEINSRVFCRPLANIFNESYDIPGTGRASLLGSKVVCSIKNLDDTKVLISLFMTRVSLFPPEATPIYPCRENQISCALRFVWLLKSARLTNTTIECNMNHESYKWSCNYKAITTESTLKDFYKINQVNFHSYGPTSNQFLQRYLQSISQTLNTHL